MFLLTYCDTLSVKGKANCKKKCFNISLEFSDTICGVTTGSVTCLTSILGSNIDLFIDTINTIFSNSKYNSSLFVCGDFNIDLLKNGEHVGTTKFIDAMYSIGLYQSRISRAERLFNYDVIDSHAVGCNSNKQNDPIDDALRGPHALASLPAGI